MSRHIAAALVSTAILVVGFSGTPAEACKGKSVLLKDDFEKVNRAWVSQWKHVEFDIGGGKLQLKTHPEWVSGVTFNGRFFPEADVCIDVTLPQKAEYMGAGITFTAEPEQGQYYFAFVDLEGQAGISLSTADGWLNPLPAAKFDGVNTKPGATNTIRLTWKGPTSPAPENSSVSFYVNDKLVDTIDLPPFKGRKVGILVDGAGNSTVEFSKFLATR